MRAQKPFEPIARHRANIRLLADHQPHATKIHTVRGVVEDQVGRYNPSSGKNMAKSLFTGKAYLAGLVAQSVKR